jgi:hypothetical protein
VHEAKNINLIWKHTPLLEDSEPFVNGKDINICYGLFSKMVFEGYQGVRNFLVTYTRTLLYHL